MWLTLQRAATASEAIATIDALCREHGYGSSGETIAIADPDEAWVLEIIGKGPGVKGAVWVAARVPEGCISASANQSRIGTFPLDDPDNWLYAPDVVSFAIERGYYDPGSGAPFSYCDAYHPDPSPATKRACATRIWSIFRRVAPSLDLSPDYHRAVEGAAPYPLFVRAEHKLGARDVMALMRDHYEGTAFDMTQGIDAGPFGCPYRFRGLEFDIDGVDYAWERPIATQQAGFVMLAQCRDWLPRRLLVHSRRSLHLLLHAALLRHHRAAAALRHRQLPPLLVRFGLVGQQPRVEPDLRPLVARLV
jgi:dipeptidase